MNDTTTALICPKCGAEMKTYERNGVTVDQCTGCRGIFLDRGELERLVSAESSFYDDNAPPQRGGSEERGGYGYEERGGHHGGGKHGGGYGSRKGKRRSFLENLLD